MANQDLFQSSSPGKLVPPATTVNEAGGKAYSFTDKHALAQLVTTGCLNATFYATGEEQLKTALDLATKVEPEFIAKAAVYAREKGFMKDMPALLTAFLATRDLNLLARVFPRVINNGKMLRNFVQIIRSGVVGRKSFGTHPKRLIRQWIESQTDDALFRSTVGNDPSMADVIRMVHPKPSTKSREALLGYIIGAKEYNKDALPDLVKHFEAFKACEVNEIPAVPFEMLTAQELGTPEWKAIATTCSWHTLRMNLNTFLRHGVFKDEEVTKLLAAKLKDPDLVSKARVFPYQLLMAYTAADKELPRAIKDALHDALEHATMNVPELEGQQIYIMPDVSGSMRSPVTGRREGATTAVRCIDVAALVAASIMRRNKTAEIIPFAGNVVECSIDPRDSVMTNARKLAEIGGGATDCSAPLRLLNERGKRADLLVMVSDNQSWIDVRREQSGSSAVPGTVVMREWEKFRLSNPKARMVCIDIQPYTHTQAPEGKPELLNIGGFSDQVFEVIAAFATQKNADHWVEVIEKVEL